MHHARVGRVGAGTLLPWVALAMGLWACGSSGGTDIEASWRVTAEGGAGPGDPPSRQLPIAEADENDIVVRVDCALRDQGPNNRELDRGLVLVTEPGDVRYGVTVRDLVFAKESGALVGSTCEVEVNEGGNRFVGACGAGMPSAEVPCALSIDAETSTGDRVDFELRCEGLSSPNDLQLRRDLVGPGGDGLASFSFRGCS